MPYLRDRLLADPLFLFKIGAEVLIDSGELSGDAIRLIVSAELSICFVLGFFTSKDS
jgi:hypothetical protein